ncbi:MAG TPA: hypothetical protein VG943_10505 [Caulobacterales bacterium]|nr:hypothetical protein [Caulobacterales bacterium]
MKDTSILEIGLDSDRTFYVRPAAGSFEFIYRAGMGVRWDEARKVLTFRDPRDVPNIDRLGFVVAACAQEYGVRLSVDASTSLTNLPETFRADADAFTGRAS